MNRKNRKKNREKRMGRKNTPEYKLWRKKVLKEKRRRRIKKKKLREKTPAEKVLSVMAERKKIRESMVYKMTGQQFADEIRKSYQF